MSDLPEWVRQTLQARFDQQSRLVLNDPYLKILHGRVHTIRERVMKHVDAEIKGDLLLWEEEMNHVCGQEAEEAYMQGIRDGAELAISLVCRSREPENRTSRK